MQRLPASPLVTRGIEIAEKHLGIDELCRRLGATPTTIEAWRVGREEMPNPEFLKLVDLLTELEPGWMSKR